MKEATGELNMTVITVVAIAAVAAFFYAFVWPNIKNSITKSVENNTETCMIECEKQGGTNCSADCQK